MNSNPNLEEITADTWEGGIKISPKDKVLLQQKNIKLTEESGIPDSYIESDEWSDNSEDGVDIEDSDEDLISESSDGSGEECLLRSCDVCAARLLTDHGHIEAWLRVS